ncbi:unnamed protein product [Musa textilis]
MADKEKECQENHVDGNDWEVVSLTASMIASAADQMGFDPSNVSKDKELKKSEAESSPLFMSSHFVFPPMEYETLKLKDSNHEFGNRVMDEDVTSGDEKGSTTNKILEESFKTKLDGSLHGIQFSEKDKDPLFGGIDIGEGKATQEMSLVLEEEMLLNSHGINDDHAETGMSGSFPCNEQADDFKPINPSYQSPNSPLSYPNASSQIAENKNDRFSLPCEAWWKRHAITLYNHAKEANTMWSVILVAALMGLAILGQRKQQEKPQLQQLKLRLSTNGQVCRLEYEEYTGQCCFDFYFVLTLSFCTWEILSTCWYCELAL